MALTLMEQELTARATRRDAEAFSELYVLFHKRVYRHLYYFVGSHHEADDLTSETFLRAWKAIERYEDRGLSIEAWPLKMAHNLGVHHLRGRKPNLCVDDVELESHGHSPERVAEIMAEATVVRNAILALPDVQRQVIVWRFLENLD